jgi:peptidoglycan LD-endopeptidase CwlK
VRRWSNASLEKLQGIHPDLRRVMDRALQEAPFDFRITEGLRTLARQKQLVAQGASKTMNSRHLTGHAVDLIPLVDMDKDGKIEAEEMYAWPLYHKLAPAIKAAAKAEGVPIEWGGDWRSFKDGPHWQLPWAQYPA